MTPLNSEKERDIITRLKENDGRAIVSIFKLYHKSFFYLARNIVKNDEQAEDIVSECFFKLWKRRGEFKSLDSIRAFMHVIIKNASIDYIRHIEKKLTSHQEILQQAEKDVNYIESKMIKTELLQLILQEVETLPPMRRKIFKLIFLEDMTVFEIARVLNITVDTVRVQKAKALQGLRNAILSKGLLSVILQICIAFHPGIFFNR
jgi:RNA polymerase sigma-70 factor (ECF subfamily)